VIIVIKRVTTALLMLGAFVAGAPHVIHAQSGPELLQNPSFESFYDTDGHKVAVDWKLTSNPHVSSDGHSWPGESMSGTSWRINTNNTAFTMTAYQFVPGIRSGSKLRFSAWANVYTCNKDNSCIEGDKGYRVSEQGSQSRTRIGADPKGGTDPNAPSVVWSSFISPFDKFQQMIIDFDSQNDNGVTVFLYATQSVGMLLNYVYWDDSSLRLLGAGQPGVSQPGSSANNTPVPQFAPAVKPQGEQPDGSIVHVVQAGDTLYTIAAAYKVTMQQVRDLNKEVDDFTFLQIGQKLVIKPPTRAATGAATGAVTGQAGGGFGAVAIPTNTPRGQPTKPTASAGSAETAVPTAVAAAVTEPPTSVPTSTAVPTSTTVPTSLPTVPPINTQTSLCITAFDDANTSHRMDVDEKRLAEVKLTLAQGGQSVKSLTTTSDAPSCFAEIAPGTYVVSAVPPTTYGLTTTGQLEVEVKPGSALALSFGAAAGYQPTPVGTGNASDGQELPPPSASNARATMGILDTMFSNSGLIVFGLAGLVLVGGLGLALVMRRR
jgi:LysM repeat protein